MKKGIDSHERADVSGRTYYISPDYWEGEMRVHILHSVVIYVIMSASH